MIGFQEYNDLPPFASTYFLRQSPVSLQVPSLPLWQTFLPFSVGLWVCSTVTEGIIQSDPSFIIVGVVPSLTCPSSPTSP